MRSIRTASGKLLILLALATVAVALSASGERTARAQTTSAVTIRNFAFDPPTLTVPVGTAVVWTQEDTIAHTVTSGVPDAPDAGALFDSPYLEAEETFSFTFTQPGSYAYFCTPHPRMRGTVVVTGGATTAQAVPVAAPVTPPAAAAAPPSQPVPPMGPPPLPANAQVVATGLNNPRGFTWGPDGALYVAESGTPPAGFAPSMGPPDEDAPPVTNMNGRITRIGQDGSRRTVSDGFPVFVGPIGDTVGVGGVAFIGDQLYAIVTAGPAHGHPTIPGGVYRIGADGSRTLIADTDAYNVANPAAFVPPDDELSNVYDVVSVGGRLYITDGNRDVVHEVNPSAPEGSRIRRLADLSRGHPVLTGIALGPDGALYVTNLTPAPFPTGGGKVWRVTLDGQIAEVAGGVSAGVGLAVGPNGTIYVSEFATTLGRPPFFEPPGRVITTGPAGVATVAMGMFFSTHLRWGPDGLYATYFGVGGNTGNGTILRLNVGQGGPEKGKK